MKTRFDGITPGDWRAGRHDMATIVDGYESKWVYAGEKYLAVASGQDIKDWTEIIANAEAIASVPQMLALLKRLAEIEIPYPDKTDPIPLSSRALRCVIEQLSPLVADTRSLLAVEEEKP